eukprot:240391_1
MNRFHLLLISINVLLQNFVYGDDETVPIINKNNDNIPSNLQTKPHKVYYYLSNPWVISVCMVVGLVLLFNISMICYLQCSTGAGTGRPSFLSKYSRKGYSNVANIDSEDISNSEMEQININE